MVLATPTFFPSESGVIMSSISNKQKTTAYCTHISHKPTPQMHCHTCLQSLKKSVIEKLSLPKGVEIHTSCVWDVLRTITMLLHGSWSRIFKYKIPSFLLLGITRTLKPLNFFTCGCDTPKTSFTSGTLSEL